MADTAITSQSTAPSQEERRGFPAKVKGFFTDVSKEMKKVTWPTREQLIDATLVTLVLCIIASLFVFGVDKIFEIILKLVYGL